MASLDIPTVFDDALDHATVSQVKPTSAVSFKAGSRPRKAQTASSQPDPVKEAITTTTPSTAQSAKPQDTDDVSDDLDARIDDFFTYFSDKIARNWRDVAEDAERLEKLSSQGTYSAWVTALAYEGLARGCKMGLEQWQP